MLINRRPVNGPWGGGNNFTRALFELAPKYGFEPTTKLTDDVGVIFMIDPRYDELGISLNEVASFKMHKPNTKVVYRINECDKRKGESNSVDPLINITSQFSDICIFISDWIRDYHVNQTWKCQKNVVIYSGVNTEHFSQTSTESQKIRIVTHHWSDNPLKGQDIYEMLDQWLDLNPDFEFTYIGRTNARLKNTRIIPPLFGKALGEQLAKHDVYVSASRFDPGPNHIIESLACKIPTYAHVDSGGAVEMVGDDHTYTTFDDLDKILSRRVYEMNNVFVPYDWDECMKRYFEQISKLFN